MKRSVINQAYCDALDCFQRHSWALPPKPRWDITDFGLGDFESRGLTLINLAAESEYCEKLMYARRGQTTPCHTHAKKKEDIISRVGRLAIKLWPHKPIEGKKISATLLINVDGESAEFRTGEPFVLEAGSRITIVPGIWHEFYPLSDECIIGEVSTANDDLHDNFFLNPDVGRFPGIEEDEPSKIKLLSE